MSETEQEHRGLFRRSNVGYLVLSLGLLAVFAGIVAKEYRIRTAEEWVPAFIRNGVKERVMVFVGASTCSSSMADGLPEALRAIRTGMRSQATERGEGFASIGISTDVVVTDGVRYLKRMGPFDEIVAGRNWANLGVQRYVWGESLGGEPGIPQLIVMERVFDRSRTGELVVSGERVLFRKLGASPIMEWSRLAFPQ